MTYTKEEQIQAIYDLKVGYTLGHADIAMLKSMARQLLAGMEQEPVGEVVLGEYDDSGCHPDARVVCIAADGQVDWENFKDGTRLYAAPPAPVSVPDAVELDDDFDSAFEHGKAVGWNNYRAAMLQGAEPVSQLASDEPVRREYRVEGSTWIQCSKEAFDRRKSAGDEVRELYERPQNSQQNIPENIPDGWVIVPVEPTEKMVIEGFESAPHPLFQPADWDKYQTMSGCEQAAHRAKLCWAAMIAAAPQQEAEPVQAAPEGWVPCSPEWIERNGPCSCAEAPRIAFGSIGNHYHPHIYHNPKHEERP